MNRSSIQAIFVALLLALACGWCPAAPVPRYFSERAVFKVPRGFGPVECLAFTSDGKSLVCASKGRSQWVQTWDLASGEIRAAFEHDPVGRAGTFDKVLAPNAKTFAISSGKTIWIWDVASGKKIATLEEDAEVGFLDLTPDGKTLCVGIGGPDGLRIWDVENKVRVRTCRVDSPLSPVAMHLSTRRPVIASVMDSPIRGKEFSLLDSFTGQTAVRLEYGFEGERIPLIFALHPDGTMLASGGRGRLIPVQLWDTKTGKRIATLKHPLIRFPALAFSPNGKVLACGYVLDPPPMVETPGKPRVKGGLLIYEVPSGKLLAQVEEQLGVGAVAFSPDGRLLATGSRDIKLWNIPESWGERKSK